MVNKGLVREFIKFGVVGVVATAIDYAGLNLSLRASSPLYLAVFVGFASGAIVGYFLNNSWTYKHLGKNHNLQDLGKYVVIAAFALLWTELIMHYLSTVNSWNANLSKLVAVFIVFFWNFFVNRLWTFRDQKETPQH